MSHATLVAVGDAVRIVTVLLVTLDLGLACAIMGIYLTANKHIARVDPRRGGTLPRYVIAIALSYTLLCAFAVAEIQGYYGTVLTWRTPIGLVAALTGIYGLMNMLSFQDSRLDARDDKITTGGTPG